MVCLLIPIDLEPCRGYGQHGICRIAAMAVGRDAVGYNTIVPLTREALNLAEVRFKLDGKFKFSMVLAGCQQMSYLSTLTQSENAPLNLLGSKLVGEKSKLNAISEALCKRWITFRIYGTQNRNQLICRHDEEFPRVLPDEWLTTYSPLYTLRHDVERRGTSHLQKFDPRGEWPVIVRDGVCARKGVVKLYI